MIPEHRATAVVSDSFVALPTLLHFLNSSLVYGYIPIYPQNAICSDEQNSL